MPIRSKDAAAVAQAAAIPPARAKSAPAAPDAVFAQALHRHLHGMPRKEIDFFVNAKRVDMVNRLIGAELRRPGASILNVACGPFALEYYLGLRDARVVSFDREARLFSLHKELVSRHLIANSEFSVADVAAFKTAEQFDVVLINDLFYSKYVDFNTLIGRYVCRVKPGGLLYFDIQDERAGPLWRAFGKDTEFRRYDLRAVARVLNEAGLEITGVEPALGIKGGVDGVIRQAMWRFARIANSYVFVARRPA